MPAGAKPVAAGPVSPPGARGPQVQPTPVPGTAVRPVQATPVAAQAKPVAKSMMQAEPSSGAESELACPACGTMISSDAIMCYACGHRMGDEDKASKKAPVSVKKVLKKKVI